MIVVIFSALQALTNTSITMSDVLSLNYRSTHLQVGVWDSSPNF